MKEVIKQVQVDKTFYQAEDGELFKNEYDCMNHECEVLLKDKHMFFDYSGEECCFDDCNIVIINSEEELEGFNLLLKVESIYNNIELTTYDFPKVFLLDGDIIDISWIKNIKHG